MKLGQRAAEYLASYLKRPRPSFSSFKDPVPAYVFGPPILGLGAIIGGVLGLLGRNEAESVLTALGSLALGLALVGWFVLYVMRPVGPSWWAEDDEA